MEVNLEPGQEIKIEMVYVSQHKKREDFLDFFRRKAERLCSLYSLRPSPEDEADREKVSEDCCTITNIEMRVEWEDPQKNANAKKTAKKKAQSETHEREEFWLTFAKDTDIIKGYLPECAVSDKKKYYVPKNGYAESIYELKSYDDKLRVIRRDIKGVKKFKKEIPLKKWLERKDKTN